MSRRESGSISNPESAEFVGIIALANSSFSSSLNHLSFFVFSFFLSLGGFTCTLQLTPEEEPVEQTVECRECAPDEGERRESDGA
jgi:hypothetical protein